MQPNIWISNKPQLVLDKFPNLMKIQIDDFFINNCEYSSCLKLFTIIDGRKYVGT